MAKRRARIKLPETLRIAEASKILNRTPMTLRRWDEAGKLKPIRSGSRQDRRYSKEQILEVLENGI